MLKGIGVTVLALAFGLSGCGSDDEGASGRGFTCVNGSSRHGELCSCRVENPTELPEVDVCPSDYPCCLELASALEQQCACFSQGYLDEKGANDPDGPREYGCEEEAAAQLTNGWKTAEATASCASG